MKNGNDCYIIGGKRLRCVSWSFLSKLDRCLRSCHFGRLIHSGTSVAAQYREASRARSPEEFVAKIEACVQEADESQLWLELLPARCKISHALIDRSGKNAYELISIFTMSKNTKTNRP